MEFMFAVLNHSFGFASVVIVQKSCSGGLKPLPKKIATTFIALFVKAETSNLIVFMIWLTEIVSRPKPES